MSYGALGSLSLPLTLAAGGLSLLFGPWLFRFPRLAIAFLLLSLIIGQSLRAALPGQGGGLLVSDLAVIIVLLSAGLKLIGHCLPFVALAKKGDLIGHWSLAIGILSTPFILWSLFTLVIHVPELGLHNTAIAFAYWARLTSHLLLLPALLILFQDAIVVVTTRRLLLLATIVLVLLGFLQLWLIPDFSHSPKFVLRSFSAEGWDPHQSRLTSTWLDPNFFGAFLAIILPFVIASLASVLSRHVLVRSFSAAPAAASEGRGLFAPACAGDQAEKASQSAHRTYRAALTLSTLVITIIVALLLTQSRSAYIALTLSILLLSPLIIVRTLRRPSPPRIIAAISSLLLALILISGAALDATAKLRLTALKEAWQLVQQHAWLGVGYNAYQFAAAGSGLISNFTIHSRAGADNSLITLWATTGLIGVALFFAPWALVSQVLFRRWLSNNNPYTLAALVSFITLLIHSQFVNSLLYSHLLITLIVITALALITEGRQPRVTRRETGDEEHQARSATAAAGAGGLPPRQACPP